MAHRRRPWSPTDFELVRKRNYLYITQNIFLFFFCCRCSSLISIFLSIFAHGAVLGKQKRVTAFKNRRKHTKKPKKHNCITQDTLAYRLQQCIPVFSSTTDLTCAIVTLAAFCFCGLECDEMRSACDGTSNLQHYNLHQQQPKQIENYVSGMLEMAHFHCVLCVLLCAVRARAMRLISHTAICLV